MAGRNDVDFLGIDPDVISFIADGVTINFDITKTGGSDAVGFAVKAVSSKHCALVADGDPVLGQLLKVEPDGICTVQVGGGVQLPAGQGATVTVGGRIVGALGPAAAKGYIRDTAATAGEAILARHTVVDVADTTKVAVLLNTL